MVHRNMLVRKGNITFKANKEKCFSKREIWFCFSRVKLIYPCVCLKGSDVGIYVTCNNTNLATLSVGLEILSSLDIPIEHLIINKGNFGKILNRIELLGVFL